MPRYPITCPRTIRRGAGVIGVLARVAATRGLPRGLTRGHTRGLTRGLTLGLALSLAGATPAVAQPDGADGFFRLAIQTVLGPTMAGPAKDSTALALFHKAAELAKAKDDKAIQVASLRGAADLLSAKVPCTDSAERVLRTAMTVAESGDRSAADALVRMLSRQGRTKDAMATLVAAYSDVPSLGRAITRESMNFLQGQAAVQFAEGSEAAALTTLNQALVIAARLKQGDTSDSVAKPSGMVDDVNAWVMYDLAMLRAHAKSASVRQRETATAILNQLLANMALMNGSDGDPHPVTRLTDRMQVGAGVMDPWRICGAASRK
jgi:hypothetical protein